MSSTSKQSGQAALRWIRPAAGPLLLGVFLLATQLAPVVHLATHHNDHTHGPQLDHDTDHEAAPLVGSGQGHDAERAHHEREHDHGELPRHDAFAHDHGEPSHHGDVDPHHAAEAPDHNPDHQTAPPPEGPSQDHGRDSIAHFGLALLQGPPPPFLPPPSETLALPPDVHGLGHRAAPRRQPPARGPPRLS